jgi:mannose/fructose-specific phosphotransferase system component IIA
MDPKELQELRENERRRSVSGVSIAMMLEAVELKNFEVQRLKSALCRVQSELEELQQEVAEKELQVRKLTFQRDEAWEELAAIRRS